MHRVGALDWKEHQLDAPWLICIPYFHREAPAPARRAEPARSLKVYAAAGGSCGRHRQLHFSIPPSQTAAILHSSATATAKIANSVQHTSESPLRTAVILHGWGYGQYKRLLQPAEVFQHI